MEILISGKIDFDRVPQIKSVKKFVEKKITRWLDEYKAPYFRYAFFYVKLEKVGDGHDVHADVHLFVGSERLRAMAMGSGIQDAIKICLKNLTGKTTPVLAGAS